jgi:tetratricopeptide (TPR) repeat protein
MNKRLEVLKKMVESGKADSFARYALALECKKEGLIEDSLAAFSALRQADPQYLPQYLMAGQMLIDVGRPDEARDWLEAGLTLAQQKGDGKTAGELQGALANC